MVKIGVKYFSPIKKGKNMKKMMFSVCVGLTFLGLHGAVNEGPVLDRRWGIVPYRRHDQDNDLEEIEGKMTKLVRELKLKEFTRIFIEYYFNGYKERFENFKRLNAMLLEIVSLKDSNGNTVFDYIAKHPDGDKVLAYLKSFEYHLDEQGQIKWTNFFRDLGHLPEEKLIFDIYRMVEVTERLEAPSEDGEFDPLKKRDDHSHGELDPLEKQYALNLYSRGLADLYRTLDLRIENLENVKQILEKNPQLRAREYIIRKYPETKINLMNLVGWNAELDKILIGRLRNMYGKTISMIPMYHSLDSRKVESKINKAGDLGAAVYYMLLKTKEGSMIDLTKNAHMREYLELSSKGKEFLRRIDLYEEKQKFGDPSAASSSNSSR